MGGKCFFLSPNNSGIMNKFIAPSCTDNFQIISSRFKSLGYEWHSVEQAFQALKFPRDSIGRMEILNTIPEKSERDENYGMRVWQLGSKRPPNFPNWVMRSDWELEKVKVMYILNLSKYASNEILRKNLIEITGDYDILGQYSTPSNRHGKNWKFWNENIQMAIRKEISTGKELYEVIEKVMGKMSGLDVENMLIKMGFDNEN